MSGAVINKMELEDLNSKNIGGIDVAGLDIFKDDSR
jgi:hypothetical protein